MYKLTVLSLLVAGCIAEVSSQPYTEKPHATKVDDPTAPMSAPPMVMPDASVDDSSCGGMQFALERRAPNVMLVIDRSISMDGSISYFSNTSKWNDLKSAIQGLIFAYDSQMRLGAAIYPSDGNCGAGNIIPYADANGSTLMTAINAQGPRGNTPIGQTLNNVLQNGKLNDPTRENVVVLATDGLPTCGSPDVGTIITHLHTSTPPIKTYIIGVGDGTASNPGLLNSWAVAGHTARTGNTRYYQTNSSTELKAAFDAIALGVASCSFTLSQLAPDPTQLYVWSNGTAVPLDPLNGFTYDSISNSVMLNGVACDAVKSVPNTKVQVVYGCPAPPPIN